LRDAEVHRVHQVLVRNFPQAQMIGEAVVLLNLSTFMPRIHESSGGKLPCSYFATYVLVLGMAITRAQWLEDQPERPINEAMKAIEAGNEDLKEISPSASKSSGTYGLGSQNTDI
jgi:hypothetical protein